MAAQVIPTFAVPDYLARTRLDGREFLFRFLWSEREGRWTFDLYDDAEALILAGVRVVANWPLLRFYKHDPRVPQGDLRAIDLTPDGTPPGFKDLGIGRRCELTYFQADDLGA